MTAIKFRLITQLKPTLPHPLHNSGKSIETSSAISVEFQNTLTYTFHDRIKMTQQWKILEV